MKVYFKYFDNIDLKYTLIPLDGLNPSTTFSKSELISFLEKNKIDVSNSNNIRYFDKRRYGWYQINEDTILPIKSKILLVLSNYYFVSKTIPNVTTYLSNQTKEINSICSLLTSSNNQNENTFDNLTIDNSQKTILILTSSPLKNFFNPSYFESDISTIIDVLKECENIPKFKYEILTPDIFGALAQESPPPDLVQIFCLSAYDADGSIYLSFEDKKGNVIKAKSDLISKIAHIPQTLFMVITPHSEEVASLFESCKVDNYIIVHSNLANNSQTKTFLQKFYKFVLQGEKISNAYSIAVNFINASYNHNMEFHCCCFHSHTEKCAWKKYAIKNNIQAHNMHMCYGCLCDNKARHVHKELVCRWVKTLNSKIIKKAKFNKNSFPHSKSDKKTFCCCSPEKSHCDVMVSFSHFENDHVMFVDCNYNNNANKLIDLKYTCIYLNYLNLNASISTTVYGRNDDLISIIENIDKSIFIIYGEKGIGKIEFVKFAGGYIYERKYVDDVIFINEDKFDGESSVKSQLKNHLEFTFNITDNTNNMYAQKCSGFSNRIDDSKIEQFLVNKRLLLIISSVAEDVQKETIKLIKMLNINYPKIKIFLISNSKVPINFNDETNNEFINVKENNLSIYQHGLKEISIEDRLNYINELEPEFLYLNGNDKRDVIKPESDLYKLLEITKGKFKRLNLIVKAYKTRNKIKELQISDLIKLIEETEDDFLDVSLIQNDTKKLSLFYLFLYSQHGWSLPDLKILFEDEFDQVREQLSQMYPLVIKREKEKVSLYQIQEKIKEDLIKKIKIIPSIKNQVKKLLIEKSSILFRKLLKNVHPSIYDFDALIHFGIWKPIVNITPTNNPQQNIIPYNSSRYYSFISNLINRALTIKSLNNFEEDEVNILEDSINEMALCIPTYLYLNKNMQCLPIIKSFIHIFDYYSNFEMKGKMYLLYAFIHSNTGIVDSIDNFPYESNYINEAIKNFENVDNKEGIGECYLFLGMIKYKYFGKKKNNGKIYMKDIATSEGIFEKNSLDYARVIFAKYQILMKEDLISNEDIDNMLNAFEICKKENGDYYYDNFLGKFIILIINAYNKIGEIDKCKEFYCNNEKEISRIIENSGKDGFICGGSSGLVNGNKLLEGMREELIAVKEKIKI